MGCPMFGEHRGYPCPCGTQERDIELKMVKRHSIAINPREDFLGVEGYKESDIEFAISNLDIVIEYLEYLERIKNV